MMPSTARALRAALLAIALALTAPALARAQSAAGALSGTERALVRAVDTHNAQALALLERLVDINSGTMNFAGVRKVGDVLRAALDSLGFTTRWVDGASFKRAGHLVAEHPGPGPKLLLIGHLDTVFEPDNPFQKFELVGDSMAHGPGVIDMKGGDVIIVYALRALQQVGALPKMNVTIVFDGDEESAGEPLSAARAALIDAAQGATAALGFEDGAGDPATAVVARRGDISWTLTSTGTPAHSSQIFTPEVGAGAIYESARVLDQFYTRLGHERYLTLSPGLVLGGTAVEIDSTQTTGSASGKHNVVAGHVTVSGDLRTISPEQLERAKSAMRDIVAQSLPGTHSAITFDDGYPPMAPTAGNSRLLALYDRVSRDLGTGAVVAVDPSRAGAADVSFVATLVPMSIDALGLSGSGGHTDKETADLRMLPVKTKRTAVLLYRLTNGAAAETVP
ncbi:MAG TPA: M20/M25/M40 family metallo-hydrolase [Gemmatimonadaceae bacterium]|nr:M20/M25/M40 family metallo-hydrolase [Gemmatimonadaceae bacterium]